MVSFNGLLLGLRVLGEGAEDRDLLPLSVGRRGLGPSLEQVDGLAFFLCTREIKDE